MANTYNICYCILQYYSRALYVVLTLFVIMPNQAVDPGRCPYPSCPTPNQKRPQDVVWLSRLRRNGGGLIPADGVPRRRLAALLRLMNVHDPVKPHSNRDEAPTSGSAFITIRAVHMQSCYRLQPALDWLCCLTLGSWTGAETWPIPVGNVRQFSVKQCRAKMVFDRNSASAGTWGVPC